MRGDGDLRSLLRTLGSATLGIGLGLAVLAGGFFISRVTIASNTVVSAATASPSPTRSPSPSPRPTATPAQTAAPTVAPTPAPTPDPLVVTAYSSQGLRLAAIAIPAGYTLTSPIAGKVSIVLYQYVDGEIRTGLGGQPSYPYVFVRSADREIKLRPGAIDKDIQLLVKDGDTVAVGAPLLRTLTTGPSSWALFYERGVTAQIIASVATAAGIEVDPVPVFKK